ncbi:FG-GAP repeat domain-containing protein [Puia sp. P3]|uniref:FG-GAP repeat domain-containing protein n=1 Tax=Puia sp. P3 TaxID=3423952 RepID=UPI003D671D09
MKTAKASALFFDANGDGFPDLYVVTGGSELPDGDRALADHLYINDGKGRFKEASLPTLLINKSCVAAADINGDGATDLFIGGGAQAGHFGARPTPSYILINDGHGSFHQTLLFNENGMPATAAFADLDGDGTPDLVVAGEWMNVKIFTNHAGALLEHKPAGPKGLWQTITITDVNGDGHPDILAGNWGLNTKLAAGKDGPLNCYVKDLDGNGTTEQLLTCFIAGEEYPFLGKDQLELALPYLKKSHLHYGEVAGKNLRYLFGNQLDDARVLHVDTLASLCLFNNGHGSFTPQALPMQLQLSPIFSFLPLPANHPSQWLALGNFYGVQPYEGRYDAANPTLFTFDGSFHTLGPLTHQSGEWRDAKLLANPSHPLIVLARNNDSLLSLAR